MLIDLRPYLCIKYDAVDVIVLLMLLSLFYFGAFGIQFHYMETCHQDILQNVICVPQKKRNMRMNK